MGVRRQLFEQLKHSELLAALDSDGLAVDDRRQRSSVVEALLALPTSPAGALACLTFRRLKEVSRALGLYAKTRKKAELVDRLTQGLTRPVVVDYFCGGGGFTRGALDAGASVACGIDCDERAEATYTSVENNRNADGSAVPFVLARVEELEPKAVQDCLAGYPGHPTIFVGCPPCQPFTNLRTTKGEHTDSSRDALRAFVNHVEALSPDFVIVENVPGIRARKYGEIWEDSVRRLKEAGYRVRYEVVNAARYGVPQKRLRTLLVASLPEYGETPWPEETHTPASYRTVQDAFEEADLCALEAGQACAGDPLHAAAKLSDLNLERIRAIRKPGGNRMEWPERLQLACYRDHDGHTDVYGRMDWKAPAPTLTTRFVSLSNGRFGHPEEDRAITPREGALLQTFPPGYKFLDQRSRDMKVIHIGNAVPPRLAGSFVGAICERLTGDRT
jgi:DNA (cytosine-5)-methyltransferase 1